VAPRSPTFVESAGRKTDRIVRTCLHEIAIGRLRPGDRLPSVRAAERLFDAHRLTVLAAYRELVALGLVRAVPQSGFFVDEAPRTRRSSRSSLALERLSRRLDAIVRKRLELSPLAAWRSLGELAEARARKFPECAFVECTALQADGHAREVSARLGVPCMPLVIPRGGTTRLAVPRHVRVLLTTAFHRRDVSRSAPSRAPVHEVPIEISSALVDGLRRSKADVAMLGIDRHVIESVARDFARALGRSAKSVTVEEVQPEALDAALKRLFGSGSRSRARRIVLSPTLFEALPKARRTNRSVLPVTYRVREEAWPAIADALGIPMSERRR
jgi:DNA-binding transcriptional regulator YhcF (GntR family)